jgi:hypothetical protein
LCPHERDFGISAEWHFLPHHMARVPVMGTVKRLTAKASLQRPCSEQIMTARQLFGWALTNIPGIHLDHCTSEEYLKQQKNPEVKCLEQSRARKLHSFIPISDNTVQVRAFSAYRGKS